MRRVILVATVILLSSPSFAQQIREFSTDTVEFLNQFEAFMSDLEDEKEMILNNFVYAWSVDSFSYEVKLEFMTTANHMLRRRARPDPQFLNLLQVMNLFLNPELENLQFRNWLTGYANLVSSTVNFNEIQRAQNIVIGMITDSALYDLAGTRWEFDRNNYRFKLKDGLPIIEFEDVGIKCIANRDTIKILNTYGTYNPITLKWIGKGGTVNWEKAGLPADMVYAELRNYRLDINRPLLNADSVSFYYKKYFDSSLEGKLEEQCRQISSPDRALYPKFFSYQGKYVIPDLFENIQYTGGLSMQGPKLVGTGLQGELAGLKIFSADTLRMEVKSQNIVIRENSMSSTSAAITIHLENDSIYHPELQFLYLEESDEIRLTKGEKFTSGVPYTNSYHKVNMNFEELNWIRSEGKMYLKPSIGRAIGQATFESYDFFNYNFYEELQGRDLSNPLVLLYRFSRELNGWREFPVTAFSQNIGKPDYQVRHQLMNLSRQGFVYFDETTDRVRLLDKMFYYIEASMGNTDYDVIFFISRVNAPSENGILDLTTYDLTIKGIPNIFLSDSQNVVLVPYKNEIIMKRNRNFLFDGAVRAGLLTMYGYNFFFDYDNFKINLQDIDSLQVSVQEYNANTGVRNLQAIDNLIQNMTGEILIDDPQNKSGLENYPAYPVFRSRENSYVYFDDPNIQGGVYDRGKVYFEVYPFEFDSLDNFARSGMNLEGRFESSGMLPPIEQTLVLQEDNSLGFRYSTPVEGIPVYNGKGTFYNDISMSSNGLHGAGRLDYLTSETYSDDFVFHPDSMETTSRDFLVRKEMAGTQFPEVKSSSNSIKWLTNLDEYRVDMQDIPFTVFEDSIQLKGDLVLTPQGMKGKGNMDLVTSSIISDQFRYSAEQVSADTADFRLKSVSSDKLAINTENVRANIDLSNQTGQFFANEDFTLVDFQDIVYESKLDFFKWDMMNETVEMGLNKPVEEGESEWDDGLNGPRYISKLPSQDSLNFMAPKAIYDYRKARLNAMNVPYIQVADVRIFPDEGNLSVGRNAVMQQMTRAGILANYTTGHYELINANVSVRTRHDYTASADYTYMDISGEPQNIHFTRIWVDTSEQTRGLGEINISDSFRLSPYFGFRGQAKLAAEDRFLTFDGGARLIHSCDIGRNWLKFESSIDPDSVLIPVAEMPLTYDMAPTYLGSMITRDSTHIYSAFVSPRKGYFDSYITTSSGILRYNRFTERFEVGPPEKLNDLNERGNYLALDNNSCKVYSDGAVNLQVDYGQVKMATVGNTLHDKENDNFDMQLMMAFEFMFSDEALAEFARDIDSIPDLTPGDLTSTFYKKSLVQFVGRDAADRMEADLGLYAEYRNIPPEFQNQKLIFSDVKLVWNQLTRTYRYNGDITIIKIGNRTINKKVEAYIELTKRTSGDLIDIYLKIDERQYYYLGYSPGSLQVISSNRLFNSIVFDLKAKDRKSKVRGGTGYIYSLAAERRPQLFLRRFIAGEVESGEE